MINSVTSKNLRQSGREVDEDAYVAHFTMDNVGNLTSLTDPLGNSTYWTRNAVGLPTETIQSAPDEPSGAL